MKFQSVQKKFGKNFVKVFPIKPDGNCCYGALSHQSMTLDNSWGDHVNAIKSIRETIAEYLWNNSETFRFELIENFEGWASQNAVDHEAISDDEKVVRALTLINVMGTWGGAETLMAFATCYNVNVIVNHSDGKQTKFPDYQNEVNKTLNVYYHESHYDSVLSFESASRKRTSEYREKLKKGKVHKSNSLKSAALVKISEAYELMIKHYELKSKKFDAKKKAREELATAIKTYEYMEHANKKKEPNFLSAAEDSDI